MAREVRVHDPSDAMASARAAAGEGWQWTRIQQEACPQCGDNPSSRPPGDLGLLAVERAARWREFLTQADDTFLRTNPEAEVFVFSPLQYGAHVRDMLKVYGDRMVLGLEQEQPTSPLFYPTQEVFESYNGLGADELATDIERWADRLATLVAGMEPSSWSRPVINDRGVYGVYTFTIAGLAGNAVHEAHHHLLDATGTLGSTPT
jgi:hypothetical protein